jgi:chromosome segregation ATPase
VFFFQELETELSSMAKSNNGTAATKEAEMLSLQQHSKQLEEKLIELDTHMSEMEANLALSEAALAEARAGRDRAEADLLEHRAKWEQTRADLVESAERKQAELAELNATLLEVQSELAEYRARCETAEAELASSEALLGETRADGQRTLSQLQECKEKHDQVLSELTVARARCEQLETELSASRALCEQLETELAESGARCEQVETELTDLKAQNCEGSQQLDSSTSQIRLLNADLAQRNADILSLVELVKKFKKAVGVRRTPTKNDQGAENGVENGETTDSGKAGTEDSFPEGSSVGGSLDALPQLLADSSRLLDELLQQQQQQEGEGDADADADASDMRHHLAYAEERCAELEVILTRYLEQAADRYSNHFYSVGHKEMSILADQ